MLVFKKTAEIERFRESPFFIGKIIGFVPTMGALHEGHASLIRDSKEQCDLTLCSIFVNPTQFNDPEDLKKYPRTTDEDLDLLASLHCDLVFLPDADQIYPPGTDTSVALDFGLLTTVMEGKFRPGHFAGVAQVVHRFLEIIRPGVLFLGQKDFQQVAVLRFLCDHLHPGVRIVMCETVREEDGLAMSSRNRLLLPEHRKKAHVLHDTLLAARQRLQQGLSPIEIEKIAKDELSIPGFKLEYFEIVDGYSLAPAVSESTEQYLVACAAVWAGKVRLIDNMILRAPSEITR